MGATGARALIATRQPSRHWFAVSLHRSRCPAAAAPRVTIIASCGGWVAGATLVIPVYPAPARRAEEA